MSGRTKKRKSSSVVKSRKSVNTIPAKSKSEAVSQAEDGVMKLMMEFFSEEMLPLFGITMKATGVLSTEEVRIKLSKGYEDFNLEMENGSVSHFEFQS
ncbi:MAG: hypothetical protein LIP10_05310 [Clostridiales bacterium]|nr:hypothetical protein [Clostridiales bacterium]